MTKKVINAFSMFTIALVSLCLAGWPTKPEPFYTSPPKISELPRTYTLEKPIITERKPFNLTIRERNHDNGKAIEHVNSPSSNIQFGAKVVISLPHEALRVKQRLQELESQRSKRELSESDKKELREGIFRSATFDKALQIMERELIRQGFNVIDRSKLEAELRDTRDRGGKDSKIVNDYGQLKIVLDEQLRDGQITKEAYRRELSKILEFQEQFGTRKREEQEITDIAEIIRATKFKKGELRAEYLFEVLYMDIEISSKSSIDIQNKHETQALLDQYPKLVFGDYTGPNQSTAYLPSEIPSPFWNATFSAKIIRIRDGSVVWIGEHKVDSLDAEENGVSLNFKIRQQVANEERLGDAIKNYNRSLASLGNNAKQARNRLKKVYSDAANPREEPDATAAENWTEQTKKNITKAEENYKTALYELKKKINNQPENLKVEYEYIVEPVKMEPDLRKFKRAGPEADATEILESKEELSEHINTLITEVTRDLIKTIKISPLSSSSSL